MESAKYLAYYALLLLVAVLGFMKFSWLVIFPAALILSGAYILVKGTSWKQVMGKSDMNGAVVFVAVLFSQIVAAALFFGAGRLLAMVF